MLWIIITTFYLRISSNDVKAVSDACTFKRYISAVIPSAISHENVTIYFGDLTRAKNACNMIGNECTGIVLPVNQQRRSYILTSSQDLYFTTQSISWRKSCIDTCNFRLNTNYVRGRRYYRKLCPSENRHDAIASWTTWSSWGKCSRSCGTSGEQLRYRQCMVTLASLRCSGYRHERRACSYAKECPPTMADIFGVDGPEGYRPIGKKTVYSTCLSKEGQPGLVPCGGDQQKITSEQCLRFDCCLLRNKTMTPEGIRCYYPIKHFGSKGFMGWSIWSRWTFCSRSCGNGTRSRGRVCTGSFPSKNLCFGTESDEKMCNLGDCPCIVNPCHNGGNCQLNDKIARGYSCECRRNFIGKHCDFVEPNLSCGNDSIVVSFDRRIISDEGLIDDMKYIHFQGYDSPQCFAQLSRGGTHYVLSIPPPIDKSCGSIVKVTDDLYSIRNKVLWRLADQSAASTVVLLDLNCVYDKKSNLTIGSGFGIQPTVRTLSTQISKVHFNIDMSMYTDDKFSPHSVLRSSAIIAEGEILYVSIDMEAISISNPEKEVLVLENCYATDTTDQRRPIYDFIMDGCSTNPAFTTIIENGQSWKGRWAFRVFEWTTQSITSDIFIVCKVLVCDSKYEECVPSCGVTAFNNNPQDVKHELGDLLDANVSVIEDLLQSFQTNTTKTMTATNLSRRRREFPAHQENENRFHGQLPRKYVATNQTLDFYHMFASKRIKTIRQQPDDNILDAKMGNFYRHLLVTTPPSSTMNFAPCGLMSMVLVGCGSVVFYVIMTFAFRKLSLKCSSCAEYI